MTEILFRDAPPAPPSPEPRTETEPAVKELPGTALLEAAAARARRKRRRRRTAGGVLLALLTVLAAAALISAKIFPLFRISGDAMAPALRDGQLAAASAAGGVEKGDIVAFYHDRDILTGRVIAWAGDWVDMDGDGTVYVNGMALEEPYAINAAGESGDIQLPCQVPERCLFVLGDDRAASRDSRHAAVGFVSRDRVIGRVVCRLWPLDEAGEVSSR